MLTCMPVEHSYDQEKYMEELASDHIVLPCRHPPSMNAHYD